MSMSIDELLKHEAANPGVLFTTFVYIASSYVFLRISYKAASACFYLLRIPFGRVVPKVALTFENDAEAKDVFEGAPKLDPRKASPKDCPQGSIRCWDPCTMQDLGLVKAFTPAEVNAAMARGKAAQAKWQISTFEQRRHLMHVISRCITENMEAIVRVACRDSGKAKVDAYMGEVLVTLEKIRWLALQGERWLLPEYRESGLLNLHKTSRVEYHAVGLVGAIVPWNYPFHNVFNPLVAAVFAGNAIVIKTSEYASWSTKFYGRMIKACLAAAGAPEDLAQIVTGYGDAGHALVTGGVDKVIFVGSVEVGKKVQQACVENLTPLVLELGGKDPFIICDDASASAIEQLACRGVFQNMGQNCAGPERFLVYEKVYEDFCQRVTKIVKRMKQGVTLSSSQVDCGAVRLPSHVKHLQDLVNDALGKGARVTAGGFTPTPGSRLAEGQFYPPTVLVDVTEDMLIWREEIFGPIMCITKVKGATPAAADDEAVRLGNACCFALSSCAFSKSRERAGRIVSALQAGMGSVNDLEGTTYLSQALPFGGAKMSGYDRFAGPEGLRGLCNVKSVVADRFVYHGGPFLALPEQIAYPATGQGAGFCAALMKMLYGHSLIVRLIGIKEIIVWSVTKPKKEILPTHDDDLAEQTKKS